MSSHASIEPAQLADPNWFPFDYLADRDVFRMYQFMSGTLGEAAFLDRRLGIDPASCTDLPAGEPQLSMPPAPAFLFHTAFCGSTLLARALHAPPRTISLKEPQVLLSLAMARNGTLSPRDVDARLRTALALLARPWVKDGRVVIKPTNQANNLLGPMLELSPHSRAILLYSGLEEFLLSCFKKLPEAQTRIRWMAQHLIAGTQLAKRLGVSPRQTFNLVESSVLAWFAQMELYAQALKSDHQDRLRSLDMDDMLAHPVDSVRASNRWLRLDDSSDLEARVAAVFARDSKASGRHYDISKREQEKAQVREVFGEIIQRAMDWAQGQIAPVAILPNDYKPLVIG